MKNKTDQKNTVRSLRILYPVWVLCGIFSIMYVPSALIEFTDSIKTVENLTENSLLFRLGIAGRLITQLLFIIIPFLLYKLFRNLDTTASILMLILALVSVPISMFNETLNLGLLEHLDSPERVMEMLDNYYQGMDISIIFWGLWLIPLGWLVFKFDLFPKWLGILLYIAGFGYLMDAFINIIFPEFNQLDFILELMTFGEMIFIIWLVFVGVKGKTNSQQSH